MRNIPHPSPLHTHMRCFGFLKIWLYFIFYSRSECLTEPSDPFSFFGSRNSCHQWRQVTSALTGALAHTLRMCTPSACEIIHCFYSYFVNMSQVGFDHPPPDTPIFFHAIVSVVRRDSWKFRQGSYPKSYCSCFEWFCGRGQVYARFASQDHGIVDIHSRKNHSCQRIPQRVLVWHLIHGPLLFQDDFESSTPMYHF